MIRQRISYFTTSWTRKKADPPAAVSLVSCCIPVSVCQGLQTANCCHVYQGLRIWCLHTQGMFVRQLEKSAVLGLPDLLDLLSSLDMLEACENCRLEPNSLSGQVLWSLDSNTSLHYSRRHHLPCLLNLLHLSNKITQWAMPCHRSIHGCNGHQ